MGLQRIRADSVAALRGQKSRAELQAENEQLRAKVETLEGQLRNFKEITCTNKQLEKWYNSTV